VWLVSFSLALTAALMYNLLACCARPSFMAIGAVLLVAPWVAGMALKATPGPARPATAEVAAFRATSNRT
jgi:hypothetical protein